MAEQTSEYVPTTEEIRDYVEVGGEPRPWEAPDDEREAARAAAFDRWLAAHDTEVAVKALEDAARHLHLAGLREKRLNRQRAYGRGVQDAARTVRSYAAMLRLVRTL